MPATPDPVGQRGPYGPLWNALIGGISNAQGQADSQRSGALQGNYVDDYGNTVMIIGQLTGQIITIGAAFQQPGVTIQTPTYNFAVNDPRLHHTVGLVTIDVDAWGTIDLTAGSDVGTVVIAGSAEGPGVNPDFGVYKWIGAANVSDPSTGTATPALPYGTSVGGYTGTYPNYTLTLSQNAQETGTGLYFATCVFNYTL